MQRRDFLKVPVLAAVPVVGEASFSEGIVDEIKIYDDPDIVFKIVPRTVDELRRAIEAEFDDVKMWYESGVPEDNPFGGFIGPSEEDWLRRTFVPTKPKKTRYVTLAGGHVKEQGEKIGKFAQTEEEAIQDAWEGFLAFKRAYGLEGTLYWRLLPENRNYYAWETAELTSKSPGYRITDRGSWCHVIYMRLWAC